jgi:hypothetical protein
MTFGVLSFPLKNTLIANIKLQIEKLDLIGSQRKQM